MSRTVRLSLGLLDRAERLRERMQARTVKAVDFRAVMERVVEEGLAAEERRLEAEKTEAAA